MKLTILNVSDARTATLNDSSEDAAMNVLLLEDKAILYRSDFASWKDFYAAASKMAKSLGAELIERKHMTTPPYHLDAMIECMKDLGYLENDEEPIRLAVHLEGGLIQGVLAKDERARNIELYVYDYDVSDIDDDEITLVRDLNDDKKEEVFLKKMPVSFHLAIDLDDIFGAQ